MLMEGLAPGLRSGHFETWGAVAGAVIGGAVSYVGQQKSNKANAKAAKNAGEVNTTTTRTGDPYADPYRKGAMDAAWGALTGGGAPLSGKPGVTIAGDPKAAPTGGSRPAPPAGKRYNAKGKLVNVRNPAPTTGASTTPAAPAARKFDGMSGETDEIRRRAMDELPAANEDLFGAGQGYVKDTLAGNSRNPLVDRATSAADDISEDPRLAAFQDYLMGELGVGSRSTSAGSSGAAAGAGGQGGRNVRYSYSKNSSGGAGSASSMLPKGGAVNSATGTGAALKKLVAGDPEADTATGSAAMLRRLVAGEAPAGWDEMQDAIARKVDASRAGNIRELRARAVGSGFYGGDLYKDLETGAIAKGDQELADSLAAARFGAWQDALGLGSEFDQSVLGLGTEYDLGMENIAAGERSASAAAGAGARANADALASQERLAKYGFMLDALDLGEKGRYGRAGALGDLAGLVSSDQQGALGAVNDITAGRRGDLGLAGDISLGADSNRVGWQSSANSLAGVRAGVNLGRAELAFDRERFYDPFSRLGQFTDITNGLYGGYGSETTTGRDTRASGGAAASSPWAAAMTGAALGGQIGSAYGARRQPSGATGGT